MACVARCHARIFGATRMTQAWRDAHDSGVAHVLFWCADDGGVLHAAVLGGLTFVPRMLGIFFSLGGVLSHAVAL